MSVQFHPYKGLPKDLKVFRTLVAQNRGYHFYYPNGVEKTVYGLLLDGPYYNGLTLRIFGWIGDARGRFDLGLYSSQGVNAGHSTGIKLEGMEVRFYERNNKKYEILLHQNASHNSIQLPGFFTLALRFKLPLHIHLILGENQVIHTAVQQDISGSPWRYLYKISGSANLLSTHISDEKGKGSSKVILKPENVSLLNYSKNAFLVIECHVADIYTDVVVSFRQSTGKYVEASFPPFYIHTNEEAIISARYTPEGWVVGTSFSRDLRLVKGDPEQYITFHKISENCHVHQMRWESFF